MPEPRPEPHPEDKSPKPFHHEPMPPHMVRMLMELSEKIGRLEGMMEVLMKDKD